ncbi:hypothetical protein F4802DRAFT_599281 [Xylaria palmicola]|nr:hypothetical protein F4802DRAFT_599281 [Xylaria palmicola]
MALPPKVAQSLLNRRRISLSNEKSQEAAADPFRVPRVTQPTDNQKANRPSTHLNEPPPRRVQDTRSKRVQVIGDRGTRPSTTPGPSSVGKHPVDRRSPARASYTYAANTGIHDLDFLQSGWSNPPVNRQGLMTSEKDGTGYSQSNIKASDAPRIVVGSHDQQTPFPGPPSFRPSRQQAPPSHPHGVGQGVSNSLSYLPPDTPSLAPFVLVEWGSPLIARIDKTLPNSWIYREVLAEILNGPDRANLVHPWPPGHPTITGAGYNPKGGECVQLTIRNRVSLMNRGARDVALPLTILDRGQLGGRDGNEVDMVLCDDYHRLLSTAQDVPMDIEPQAHGAEPPAAGGHQVWPAPAQSQNATTPVANPVFDQDFAHTSSMWTSASNQGQNAQAQFLTPPFSYDTLSSSLVSSAPIASSTTSPDGLFSMENMPFSQESYANGPWPQPNGPGA